MNSTRFGTALAARASDSSASRERKHERGAGQYLKLDYPASTASNELQVAVTYTLWIPDGVKTLRGIIVHQHGAGTTASIEGSTAAYDLHWQALAKKWDCALWGSSYHVQNEKIDTSPGASELWFDPRRGSEKTFLKALADFAAKSGHPEIDKDSVGAVGTFRRRHLVGRDDDAASRTRRRGVDAFRLGADVSFASRIYAARCSRRALQDPDDDESRREGKTEDDRRPNRTRAPKRRR